jgi:transcriptional regulator with XRE-family HTH domain
MTQSKTGKPFAYTSSSTRRSTQMHESQKPIFAQNGPQAANRRLALRLRAMRLERSWSLDRAALETGVSKAMLGQIERGESSPTVATLWKIAGGFACSLTHFLVDSAGSGASSAPLLRQADTLRTQPASDAMLVAPLFPYDPALGFELFELILLPGYVRQSEAHAAGVIEHVIITLGNMEVLIDDTWTQLAQGDGVRFAADKPHGYRNLGRDKAVCLDLIHYPHALGSAAAPKPGNIAGL